jgi:hypothetical protein
MNIGQVLRNPQVRAKVMGSIFIAIGIYLIFLQKESVYLKIGFGAVFIGIFTFFVITERTTPKILYDAQMLSNMELLNSLINNLHLEGNGTYVPASGKLSKERVFIPAQEGEKDYIPELDDNMFFIPKTNKSSLNVVLVPPGLELLETYEKELGIKTESIQIDELMQYLQIMIYGLDLIRDLSLEREGKEFIRVTITHSQYGDICKKIVNEMRNICRQTGCPICSSILCAVTRALSKKIRIQHVDIKENEISYLLKVEG